MNRDNWDSVAHTVRDVLIAFLLIAAVLWGIQWLDSNTSIFDGPTSVPGAGVDEMGTQPGPN